MQRNRDSFFTDIPMVSLEECDNTKSLIPSESSVLQEMEQMDVTLVKGSN